MLSIIMQPMLKDLKEIFLLIMITSHQSRHACELFISTFFAQRLTNFMHQSILKEVSDSVNKSDLPIFSLI